MKTEKITIISGNQDMIADLTAVFPKRDFQAFARYLQQAQRDECAFLVALDDGQPAGYCLVYWQSEFIDFSKQNIPEIVDLVVAQDYRRQGIGQQILQEIERYVLKKSPHKVGLMVLESNIEAKSLYQKSGYLEISRQDVPSLNDTNLMLIKDLVT